MNSVENVLMTESRFISNEVQSLLNDQMILMANWKWIVLAIALLAGVTFRPFIQYAIQKIKNSKSVTDDSSLFWKYLIHGKIESPISWIITCGIWLAIIDASAFHPFFQKYLTILTRLTLSIQLIKLAYLGVEAVGEFLIHLASKTENSIDDQLAPFATKALKVIVVIIGGLLILQNLGVDVTALLAGVGIAGMALAFAAKDTVENVFGSLTIIFDGPFKMGDYIKIGDTEGIVEDVGFRSTRIRTFYNSVISIPNAEMARTKIDNYQLRPKRRIRFFLGLEYSTTPEKMQEFCRALEGLLKSEPGIDPTSVIVKFQTFGDFSLNVLVVYHIQTIDSAIEMTTQEQMNFRIMELASRTGVGFAFPTQKILIEKELVP